jgi:LAGLIDADG endonuclease
MPMEKSEFTNNNSFIIKHFKNENEILLFLEKNPIWLSGFVCGEGCFTGYLSLDLKSLWGLQPGLDFNITQSTNDLVLLNAINAYFEKKGGIYAKPNNVSVIAFRNVKILKNLIIPFFLKYPLVGIKNYEFEKWAKLVDIYYNKKHIGKNISSKEYILHFAKGVRNLNIKRSNQNKIHRIDTIINWLTKLKDFPSKKEKLDLIEEIKNLN